MPGNTIGQALTLTSWGTSHGPAIGGIVDGIPPGIFLDISAIQSDLDRRKPGRNAFVTPRQEDDKIEILSGVYEDQTTGTPLSFLIRNTNQRSQDYEKVKQIFRPGHADYTYQQKYGHVDYRGGGRASARETAVRVAAGGIARQILASVLGKKCHIQAAVIQLGEKRFTGQWQPDYIDQNPFFCPDAQTASEWETYLSAIKDQGLSVGALIEGRATGIPTGLGEPVYDKLDADLAKALMSINAVKAVEIGDGFEAVSAPVGYDEMTTHQDQPTFLSNRAGGILGGISTGQDIICRVALKPTSSTAQQRQTINKDNEVKNISITGRHDPCVGIRAVPIVEAMMAFTLADHLLRWRGQCGLV